LRAARFRDVEAPFAVAAPDPEQAGGEVDVAPAEPVIELEPVEDAGPVVEAAQTYLSATFDGSQYFLYVFTPDRDVDAVRYELAPQSYAPNTSGDFSIGIAGPRRALVPPFPGPNNVLYPFSGRVQEVAIYDHALKKERVTSHILSAF